MTEDPKKRTFEAQPAIPATVRLEASGSTPALDKLSPEAYERLTPKQREALVGKLINFLKAI
jgi:hypothetical protein